MGEPGETHRERKSEIRRVGPMQGDALRARLEDMRRRLVHLAGEPPEGRRHVFLCHKDTAEAIMPIAEEMGIPVEVDAEAPRWWLTLREVRSV